MTLFLYGCGKIRFITTHFVHTLLRVFKIRKKKKILTLQSNATIVSFLYNQFAFLLVIETLLSTAFVF